jgi:hypothetical protein
LSLHPDRHAHPQREQTLPKYTRFR